MGSAGEKICRGNSQSLGELLHDHDRRVTGTPLNIADIGPVNPSLFSKPLLTEAEFNSVTPNVPAQANFHIHPAT